MYRADRLRAMLAHLQDHPVLNVDGAMELFHASSATVRRDFAHLISQGLVSRGPNEIRRMASHATGVDQPMALREVAMRREKDAIARRACMLLGDGDVAFVDGGTTTHAMVRHMASTRLHVITTCIRIANALNEMREDTSRLEVAMPGGILMPHSYVLYGPHTCAYLQSYTARWAFIGVDGTDGSSLLSVNEFIAESQRTMIRNSDHTVLLADHTKFGRPSMIRTAELDSRFTIITDGHESSEEMLRQARANGTDVITVTL